MTAFYPTTMLIYRHTTSTHNDHYLDHSSGNNDSSGDSGSPMGVRTDKKRGKLHEHERE